MYLDLKFTETPSLEPEQDDRVVLYSKTVETELICRINHLDQTKLGGVILEPDTHPMVRPGDHIHFKRENILRLEKTGPG